MEGIILILLLLVLFVIVLPLTAMGKATGASARVMDLRRRLDKLQAQLQEPPGAPADVKALAEQVKALAERVERLDGEAPPEIDSTAVEEASDEAAEPDLPVGEFIEPIEQEWGPAPAASMPAKLPVPADAIESPAAEVEEEPAWEQAEPKPAEREPVAAREVDAEPAEVKAEAESIEMKLGTYWFVRIGVVLLLTGAGILAYYKKQFFIDLSPLTKVCGLYVLSALMGGVGFWLQRAQERYVNYGQVLVAGGFAGIYFTTYAAHIFPPVRVIPDPTVVLLLLLAWGGFMVWVADRLKSETLALFAIGASYYATYVPLIHSGGVSHSVILASNLILAVAAVVFMLRNRWLKMPVVSMGAAYAGFLVWRLRVLEHPSLAIVLLFAVSLWVVYTAAVFLSRHEAFDDKKRAAFLTANNAALFGLLSWEVLRDFESQFWILPLALGAVLLGCALAMIRWHKDQLLSRNSYLTQGLVLVTLGLMTTQLSDSIKGPIFAAESVVLLFMAIRRDNLILQVGALLAAGLAGIYAMIDVDSLSANYLHGGLCVGAFLLFNAWLCHRALDADIPKPLRPRVTYFAGLGMAIALVAFLTHGHANAPIDDWRAAILIASSLLFCASVYALRLREFVLLGQVPALIGGPFAIALAQGAPGFSWPLSLALLGMLGLAHWWRWERERLLACCPEREEMRPLPLFAEGVFSAGAVLTLLAWLSLGMSFGNGWLVLGSLLAAGLVVYGVLTRAPFIAAFGQVFLALACWVQIEICLEGTSANALQALVPIATMLLTNLALPLVARRIGNTAEFAALGFGTIQTAYRIIAGALGLLWIYRFVPDDFHVLATALAGIAFLVAHCWRPAKEWHWLAGAYVVVSSIYLVAEFASGVATWQSLAAIVALLGLQQLARHRATQFAIPDDAHKAIILGGGVAMFFWATNWVSQWMPTGESQGLHSITWAALAVIFFGLGLKLRERWYRLMGLVTLGVALLSLFPIIWQMSTELKIASFFVLGMVFVGLGFVYNRNKEQIKKLL